jgi:hypothetical protein
MSVSFDENDLKKKNLDKSEMDIVEIVKNEFSS